MKKNVIFRIAAIVLMCTLVTACFASSTFARYTSKATGTDNLVVAKWQIEVGNDDISSSYTTPAALTFNLADSILDTYGEGNAADTEVKTGYIAPGTHGQFGFDTIYNKSQVDANVTVTMKLEKTNSGVTPANLQYKLPGGTWTPWTEGTVTLVNPTEISMENGEIAGQTIEWQWAYGEAGVDNAAGVNPATFTVTLEILVDQAD